MLLRPAYLSQKLIRPLRTKDGGNLRTVLDARTYMLELSLGSLQTHNVREHEKVLRSAMQTFLTGLLFIPSEQRLYYPNWFCMR